MGWMIELKTMELFCVRDLSLWFWETKNWESSLSISGWFYLTVRMKLFHFCLCQKIWNRSKCLNGVGSNTMRFNYIWQFLGISKRYVFRTHCAGLGPSFVRLFMPITKFNDVSSTLWLICGKSINSSSTQQERLTQVLYYLTSLSQVNSNGLIISTEPTIVARTRVWAHCTKTTPFRRQKSLLDPS